MMPDVDDNASVGYARGGQVQRPPRSRSGKSSRGSKGARPHAPKQPKPPKPPSDDQPPPDDQSNQASPADMLGQPGMIDPGMAQTPDMAGPPDQPQNNAPAPDAMTGYARGGLVASPYAPPDEDADDSPAPGDMDHKAAILAGLRKRYDAHIAIAQGALHHGDLDAAMHMAQRAHDQVPDGKNLSFGRTPDGNVGGAVSTPDGRVESTHKLSPQQFHHYLVGPATSFDHVIENGVGKNLSIASGQRHAPAAEHPDDPIHQVRQVLHHTRRMFGLHQIGQPVVRRGYQGGGPVERIGYQDGGLVDDREYDPGTEPINQPAPAPADGQANQVASPITAESGYGTLLPAAWRKFWAGQQELARTSPDIRSGPEFLQEQAALYRTSPQARGLPDILADYINGTNAAPSDHVDRQIAAAQAANPNADTAQAVQQAVVNPSAAAPDTADSAALRARIDGLPAPVATGYGGVPMPVADPRGPPTGEGTTGYGAAEEDPARYTGQENALTKAVQIGSTTRYEMPQRPGREITVNGKTLPIYGTSTTPSLPKELRGVRPDGSFRVPLGADMRVPTGYDVQPAEDISLGKIAVPRGTATGQKDVVKYLADGTPVPLRIPSTWDPSKIQYAGGMNAGGIGANERQSGPPVFDHPPPGMPEVSADAAGPPKILGGPTYTGKVVQGTTASGPIGTASSSAFGPPAPWTPTLGRGTAGVPPPSGDNSPEAQAARLFPSAGQAAQRSAYLQKAYGEAQKLTGQSAIEQQKTQSAERIATQKLAADNPAIAQKAEEATLKSLAASQQQAMENIRLKVKEVPSYKPTPQEQELIDLVNTRTGQLIRQQLGTRNPAAPAAPAGNTPTPAAIAALRANPARRAEFDAYYGQGASDRALGKQ